MQGKSLGLTRTIARFIVETKEGDIPSDIFDHAKVAFMDWIAVALAGKDDPLVEKLIRYADLLGGNEQATILGRGIKKSIDQAALINGAASHALDYDDSIITTLGHPSVTLFPSSLALAEWSKKKGADLLTAYIIGFEVLSTIGKCGVMDHYMSGWHSTSTIGHFASAAACSRLLELDEQQTLYALGIAGTQACGLKRSFGTMCKPFHAGRASQAGLMAALLAREGFTGAEDILEGPNGYLRTLNGKMNEKAIATLGKSWDVENIAQKYHASCHATHSPIEAALAVVEKEGLAIEDIKSIKIHSSQLSLDAAGKTEPKTGLEGKFSIPCCVANALLTGNTGMQAFTNEKVNAQKVKKLMENISIGLDKEVTTLGSRVEMETVAGKVYTRFADIMKDIPRLEIKKARIKDKFTDLCTPLLGDEKTEKLMETIILLEKVDNIQTLIEQVRL